MWPGFGENMRVLRWIIDRCKGSGAAVESAIGHLPGKDAIDTTGLNVTPATMAELLSVAQSDWRGEVESLGEFFAKFGSRLPAEMEAQRAALAKRLG